MIRKDKEIEKIFSEGFECLVIDSICEQTWPNLPDLVQRALNSNQNVASCESELEVMSSMLEYYNVAGAEDEQMF